MAVRLVVKTLVKIGPTQNQTIWFGMTRLSLIWNLLKQSGHPTARSPFTVSPSGPPNDLVHVITTRAVELSVPQNDNNCGVNSKGLLSKFLGNKKYNIFPSSVSFSYCLLPQSDIRLFASRNRAQIFSSQVPMAGHTQRAVHGGKIHLIVMTISIAVEA